MRFQSGTAAILILLGGIIAFVGSIFVYLKWHVALHASHYERAAFVVDRVDYSIRRRGGRIAIAYGTIHGTPESIFLSRYGPTPASKSSTELERLYPRGTEIPVLHDASASQTFSINGYKLRSLPVSYDLSNSKRSAVFTLLVAYGPLFAGLALQLHLTRKEKRLGRLQRQQQEAKAARKRAWREANGPRRSYFLKRKKRR